jgi:hypothetical protein
MTKETKKQKQKRTESPWISHVKKYALENDLSYKEATKKAKDSYIKKPQVYIKKEKKKTQTPQIYKCNYCNYSGKDKSNFNRHMKSKHLDYDKQRIEAIKTVATVKKYTRGLTSKNPEKVIEAKQKITEAEKKKTELKKVLNDLQNKPELLKKNPRGRPRKNPEAKLSEAKPSEAKTKTNPSKAKPSEVKTNPPVQKFKKTDILKKINDAYEYANDTQLNLKNTNIKSFKQDGHEIEIELKPGFIVDQDEYIDFIKLIHDPIDDHFDASFLQKSTDIRVKDLIEYDILYIQ